MTAVSCDSSAQTAGRLIEALDYRAPFLIEKLLKERIVDSADEGQALFTEAIRYLILDRMYPEKRWEMFSRRIDEVWHQFILFTYEYMAFCNRYAGSFLHHYPSNAPGAPSKPEVPIAQMVSDPQSSYHDFCNHYQKVFGMRLPDLWMDRTAITLNRRMVLDNTLGVLRLEENGDTLALHSAERGLILSVNSIARAAVDFVLQVRTFYVRELPGDLSDDEKVGLAQVLAFRGVLLLAS